MKDINRPQNGFRYGVNTLEVLQEFATFTNDSKTYKIVLVRTDQDQNYISIKLYNRDGKFVRQFLIEPEIAGRIGKELCALYVRSEQK
ncbi:MAG: hypothetical protein KAH98_00715 [Dehalococcoidia bacterium]|nr:hypothetical protein [Dehalococcoidia bacterium]MCK5653639.1 hypothetical protein [Dehalococcoidia bacterium]